MQEIRSIANLKTNNIIHPYIYHSFLAKQLRHSDFVPIKRVDTMPIKVNCLKGGKEKGIVFEGK